MTRRVSKLFANLGIGVLILIVPSAARASSIVFTNFGAGLSYDASVGNPVGDDGFGLSEWPGETFVSAGMAKLSTIEIAVSAIPGFSAVDPITVALRSDSADSPDAVLESFTVLPGALGVLGTLSAPVTLTSIAQPLLTPGTRYWLTAAAPDSSGYAWNFNSTGANADHAVLIDGGGSWFVIPSGFATPGGFQIDGDAVQDVVPEPASLLLLGTGFIGTALGRRRVRRRTGNQAS